MGFYFELRLCSTYLGQFFCKYCITSFSRSKCLRDMELKTLIAADWKYKAEGNKHVVLFNNYGQVLRLKKSSDPMNGEYTNSVNPSPQPFYKDHLDFLTYVIRPLLQNSDLCEIPSEINLPLEFITNIGNLIEKERPSFRRNKSLHSHQPALLMTDSSLMKPHPTFLDCEMEFSSTVFCVELKTKKGFMSNIDPVFNKSVCQFCSTQVYRTSNSSNSNTRASYYCPIDLFSGNHYFMRRALEALVEVPSNNLRVFKNGQIVYSQEILDELGLSGIHDCESFLETLLTFPYQNNSTDLGMYFYDVLIQTLLLPITGNVSSAKPKHVCSCHSIDYKQKSTGAYSKKYELKQYSQYLDTSSSHESMLPCSSVLGIVLSAQKISYNDSAQNILDSYQRITTNTDNSSNQMVLIDAPYTALEWKRIGHYAEQAYNYSTNIKQTRSEADDINIVRRFLVAKSLCDCSIMISFKRITFPSSVDAERIISVSKNSSQSAILKLSDDLYLLVSVTVVDTDPKLSSKVPHHIKQHCKIRDWWHKEFP